MKTKLTPLALLIPAVVLAQPAPQAPQSSQAVTPIVNQQVNPANTPIASTKTAAQTLPTKNSNALMPPVNPVAAAAYDKASKSTKSMSSTKYKLCTWVTSLDRSICT